MDLVDRRQRKQYVVNHAITTDMVVVVTSVQPRGYDESWRAVKVREGFKAMEYGIQ